MTPEELMSLPEADEMQAITNYNENPWGKKSGTAMERYYQRLVDSEHSTTTNKPGDWSSESGDNETNSVFGTEQNENQNVARLFDSPFMSHTDRGIFQPDRATDFSDVFDSNPDPATMSDEEIRAQKEQEAHMDAFKQLWNIDQPAASSFTSSPGSGGTFPSAQPGLAAPNPSPSVSSAQQNPSSSQDTLSIQRSLLMQQPNFNVPQRRF